MRGFVAVNMEQDYNNMTSVLTNQRAHLLAQDIVVWCCFEPVVIPQASE